MKIDIGGLKWSKMAGSVEYFRFWRSLGIVAVVCAFVGLIVWLSRDMNGYSQGGLYVVMFIGVVALLARLYIFRPLLVAIIVTVLVGILYSDARRLDDMLQLALLVAGGGLAGALAVWAARPQHFGVAVVMGWLVCVIVAVPLTVL